MGQKKDCDIYRNVILYMWYNTCHIIYGTKTECDIIYGNVILYIWYYRWDILNVILYMGYYIWDKIEYVILYMGIGYYICDIIYGILCMR